MHISYNNKVILITGASEGIGLAIAKTFGTAGGKVAICGRSRDKLDKAAKELSDAAVEVFSMTCDVTDFSQFRAFADGAEKALGPIDVFVNNAGYFPFCMIKDMDEALWDKTVDTNLKSAFLGSKIAYEKMKDRGGVLINASSFASKFNGVGYGVYAATKWGINVLTRTLAAEYAPYGIRVFAYAPGVIDTALTQDMIKAHGEEGILSPIPLRRVGKPEDVANVVAFLASDYAGYVSGSVVEIDGAKYSVQNPSLAWERSK